ncbi:MAG: hypothetical protein K2N73_04590 [Lachnospiraceae bacterium]|nr:hypothetical protein [Lachnospiraceae bacterium]
MRSTKLRSKVMAGILCAAMVFQSVPVEAVASEVTETVQNYDSEEMNGTEDEVGTNTVSALSEDAAENRSDSQGDVPETSNIIETSGDVETVDSPDAVETSDISEESEVSETFVTIETPDAAESGDSFDEAGTGADTTESPETESGTTDIEEVTETEELEETEGTEQEIALLADELPDYKKLLSVVTEYKYYFYDNVKEIFVKLEGCEIPETGVGIEFYIDKDPDNVNEQPINYEKRGDYYVISFGSAGISEGTHHLTVKLKDTSIPDGEYLVSRDNIAFEIERVDNVFTEADKYYISSTDDTIEVAFYNPADDIESVQITAANGDVVARSGQRSPAVDQIEDPRYTGIGNGYEYPDTILHKTTWVLPTEKNALEIGNYDIRLTLEGGTERMISNAVEVSSRAVVTKCVLGMDYDNTSNLIYLYIQGTGFNPSQVRFDFVDEATSAILSTTRIDYKTVQSGYIVKFRKEGNWDKAGKEIKVTISKKSGNIDFTQNEFDALLESGIYYAEYNSVLSAIEVGVTTDLNGKAVSFKIVDAADHQNIVSEVTSRSLTESLAYLTPLSPENLQRGGRYCVELTASGNVYYKEFKMNQGTPSTNHWEASAVISQNAERNDFYYCAVEAGINNDELDVAIDGYSADVAFYANEWAREDGAKGTRIQVWIPTRKLSVGQHTVRITRNGNPFSSYTFEVVAADYDKFVLDTYSLSWIDDNTIQVYMKTPNCADTDDFDIKLTGVNDREPAVTTTVVTDRYTDSVFMNVTGLNKSSAFKDYYVLITHKKFGQPFKMSNLGEKFYADEDKGEKKSISSNKGLPVISNNRVIGINIQNLALPATLTIYATDTTAVISKLTIPSTVEGNYYYFTKEFYDSFVNKDRLYDMTLSDYGENWGRSYARINIGYKGETTVNDFDLKITSDTLYIDGPESGRSAVLTVTGNTQKPVFEVSDDTVIELEDYIETSDGTGVQSPDPNKKRVIAKSTGATNITVIADGVKKSIFVTVTRSASGITINTANRSMKVGDSFVAEAYILPKSAEDPTQVVNFTSSDSNVLYVRKLTNTTANVTALKAGTAVLRATLEGTTYTVAVTVSITDSFPLYDKKEIKIKEVGIVSYIEAIDQSLSSCALPEGWEWDNGDLVLTASEQLQYCWATYTEEGYQPFSARLPVAVTRISGIDVTGRTLINQGQKETYKITYQYAGADINTPKFRNRITVNCVRTSEDDIAAVESLEWDKMVIAAKDETGGGTVDFRLTLAIDNGIDQGSNLFAKNFTVHVPLTDCVNSVKVKPIKASGQNFDYYENEDRMEVDENDIKTSKYSVELQAEAAVNGIPKKNVEFKWETDDDTIATVGKNEKGTVTLAIKKAGTVKISAIAEDEGNCAGTLTVDIMDYAPVLEESNVTINKYRNSGTEFAFQEQNGNRVKSMRILEGESESQNFSASVPVGGISTLRFKTGAPAFGFVKKTVSNCSIVAVTEKGTYKYALKVTTDVTKPSATVKLKTKANLFYTDAEAVYTVSSKYDIQSVEDVTESTERERFYAVYDRASSTIHFNTGGTLNSSTLGQFMASRSPRLNVKLKITFADYREPQTIEVKVATENKKPSLGITGMVTCPGISKGIVNVINSKTKEAFSVDAAPMTFKIVKPTDGSVDAEIKKNSGGVSITYAGTKNLSYTAEVASSEWTQAVNVNGKISYIKSPEKLSLAMGSKQLTLNMATNITANGTNTIPVFVNGSNIAITKLTYDGTAQPLIDTAGYLDFEFKSKDQSISLGLNAGKRGAVKPGTYKLNLYATVNVPDLSAPDQVKEVQIKKTTLTIKLTEEGTAKVTLASPKGQINLIDRANTSVVYTPKVSGIDASIKSVSVDEDSEYAECFTAFLNDDNKVEVKVKAGRSMSVKDPYKVTIVSVLNNGFTVKSSVKIKPVNKLPKIVFSPAKCNLYRSNNNKYTVSVSLKNSSIDLNNITGIKIDTSSNKSNADKFLLVNNISKNGTVSFGLAGDRSSIRKGQYKIKCLVTFRDADSESKPAAVNMTITVK